MPKKKANANKEPEIVYDVELTYGEPSTNPVKARKLVSYGDFMESVDMVIQGIFKNGYSPAKVPYIYHSSLFTLFTNYSSIEPDDVLKEVYVNHLDEAIYNTSDMAIAFRDAVKDGIEYHKKRSALDVLLEKASSIDMASLEKLSKEDITKWIKEAVKG